MADTCATCRYFLVEAQRTICRRYPPVAIVIPASMIEAARIMPLWPNPDPGAYCGEYRPAEVALGGVLRFPQRDTGDENPSGGLK